MGPRQPLFLSLSRKHLVTSVVQLSGIDPSTVRCHQIHIAAKVADELKPRRRQGKFYHQPPGPFSHPFARDDSINISYFIDQLSD